MAAVVVIVGMLNFLISVGAQSGPGPATLLTWPLVMLAMAYLLFRVAFPFLIAGRSGVPDQARVAAIRATGPALWSGYPGGLVGGMRATAAMLGASVHPGGIVVTPRFMEPAAIRTDEIRRLSFGRRFGTPTIVVDHAGVDVASPLVLYGSPASAQATALGMLVEWTAPGASAASVTGASPAPLPGAWSAPPSGRTPSPRPPVLMTVMSAFGLIVGIGLVVYGLTVVIPKFGAFGVVWTAFGVVILAINVARFVRRGW